MIELLVVIGVIAIMAAMLVMAVNKSRERARYTRWLAFSTDMEKDDGLVGHWRFLLDDYRRGEVTNSARGLNRQEYDQSKWNGNPVGNGYAWGSGRYMDKKGMTFGAGTNDGRVAVGLNLMDLSASFTIAAWVKVPGDQNMTIVSQGTGVLPLYVEGGELKYDVPGGGGVRSSGQILRYHHWALATVCYDAELETLTSYVNGETTLPNGIVLSGSSPHSDAAGKFLIGNTVDANAGVTDAWIDELAVYDRSLTQEQVRDMYRMGTVD